MDSPTLSACLLETQDGTAISGAVENGKTSIVWSRKLNTGDVQNNMIVSNSIISFSWAYHSTSIGSGSGSTTTYPQQTNFDQTNLNLVAGATVSTPSLPPSSSSNSFVSTNGDFQAIWVTSCDGNFITFTMVSAGTGWSGLGFSPSTPHSKSEMYACWIDTTGQVVVVDGYSNSFDMPDGDTQQDGVAISGSTGDTIGDWYCPT